MTDELHVDIDETRASPFAAADTKTPLLRRVQFCAPPLLGCWSSVDSSLRSGLLLVSALAPSCCFEELSVVCYIPTSAQKRCPWFAVPPSPSRHSTFVDSPKFSHRLSAVVQGTMKLRAADALARKLRFYKAVFMVCPRPSPCLAAVIFLVEHPHTRSRAWHRPTDAMAGHVGDNAPSACAQDARHRDTCAPRAHAMQTLECLSPHEARQCCRSCSPPPVRSPLPWCSSWTARTASSLA